MSGRELIVTDDVDILSHPQYKAIEDVIHKLDKSGIIWNLHGNCFAAADMVSTMLTQSGIENTIVECQVSICEEKDGNSHFSLIGYDNFSFNGQIDTHVVVVTKTTVPVLIDLSVSKYMPEYHPFIIEKVDQSDPNNLCSFNFEKFSLIYQVKKSVRIPELYQKTLLEKIKEDHETKNKIKFTTKMIWLLLLVGVFNFIANMMIIF